MAYSQSVTPRIATSAVGAYVMTATELQQFIFDMWSTTLIETIQKAVVGDGGNALLGLKFFPNIEIGAGGIEVGTSNCYVTLGNLPFRNSPAVPIAIREVVEIDFGTIDLSPLSTDPTGDSYLDWAASDYKLYLPYVGTVDLNPNDIVGRRLHLVYRVNITDGSALCLLTNELHSNGGVSEWPVFTTSFSYGYDVPLRVDSVNDAISRTLNMASGVLPFSGSFGNASSYTAGSLAPNANFMGDQVAKLIRYRKDGMNALLPESLGTPSTTVQTVEEFSGYLQVEAVYDANSVNIGARHYEAIVALLKEGIYV